MKKFELENSNSTIFIGEAREIASLYRNLKERDIAYPIFSDVPKFNMTKMYGLIIDKIHYEDYVQNYSGNNIPDMQVVSSDTALRILLEEKEPLWIY